MAKVVYNNCYGGFSISAEAVRLGKQYSPNDKYWLEVDERYGYFEGPRHDETLVRVVEELGEQANGSVASLAIEHVPSGTPYRIDEYDGNESVMTNDSYGWVVAP